MKKIDWIEYFEAVNGRSPEEAEIAAALAAGEFEEEVVDTTAEIAQDQGSTVLEPVQVTTPVQETSQVIPPVQEPRIQ